MEVIGLVVGTAVGSFVTASIAFYMTRAKEHARDVAKVADGFPKSKLIRFTSEKKKLKPRVNTDAMAWKVEHDR